MNKLCGNTLLLTLIRGVSHPNPGAILNIVKNKKGNERKYWHHTFQKISIKYYIKNTSIKRHPIKSIHQDHKQMTQKEKDEK